VEVGRDRAREHAGAPPLCSDRVPVTEDPLLQLDFHRLRPSRLEGGKHCLCLRWEAARNIAKHDTRRRPLDRPVARVCKNRPISVHRPTVW
jgi:hypothetical protein